MLVRFGQFPDDASAGGTLHELRGVDFRILAH